MFICGRCGKVTAPCEPQVKVVVETRNVIYLGGHRGIETVKEIAVCQACHAEK
jgi:hypothetical protein